MKKVVYLGLGSNVGDRKRNLDEALERLRQAGLGIQRVSAWYETEPVDYRDQPWFLNCVAEVVTELMPLQLLKRLQKIEWEMGRRRVVPRGPRNIDLDILFYGRHVIDRPELTVPHPRLHERRFVLEPLRELNPELRHPVTKKSVSEMLAALPAGQQIKRIEPLSH